MKKHINKLPMNMTWREVVEESNSFWSDDDITSNHYGDVSLQDFR